ncbi:MAG: type I DNA topoisomerase, partial [Candidatus Xenobia bacterium]
VSRGLSAGRVQTVAVRLVCDREREILAFVPEEYWSLQAVLRGEQAEPFGADLIGRDGKKYRPASRDEVEAVMDAVRPQPFTVARLIRQERKLQPPPPFTTSTLQQEAGRRLRMKAQRTMQVAQQLYEGIDLGEQGPVGLITYMRTDSVRVADVARGECQAYIRQRFGAPYVGHRVYHAKDGAQDAHEAIRPTAVERTPQAVGRFLDADQLKLYSLIWERFVASQMAPCELELRAADIQAGVYTFRTTGSTVMFAGYTALTGMERPDRELPPLREGEVLSLLDLKPAQHFTEPPFRYTEATLIKALEERGIGRPSTYAPIVDTIQRRDYVRLVERYLVPTDVGFVTTDLLARHFTDIVSPEFTASMEQRLDEVEQGTTTWVQVLQAFYGPFEHTLQRAWADGSPLPTPPTRPALPAGAPKTPARGGRGSRGAAPSAPARRRPRPPARAPSPRPRRPSTRPKAKSGGAVMAPKCPRGNCGGTVVERKSRNGKRFWGCNRWPECSYVSWNAPQA